MLSIGSSQQVMLEVRFSEIKRSALKQFGLSGFITGGGDNGFRGAIGGGASLTPGGVTSTTIPLPGGGTTTTTTQGPPTLSLGSIIDSFGILTRTFNILGLEVDATLDALERKGLVNTLAEPTLVALSGETASFLAGGEFPVPVAQDAAAAERRRPRPRLPSSGSRSASAWPSRPRCLPTASSTSSSRRKSARSTRAPRSSSTI